MEKEQYTLVKWLRILLCLQIAGLACSFLDGFPIQTSFFRLTAWLCNAASMACLFALAPVGKRYRYAAILGSVQLLSTLIEMMIQFFARIIVQSSEMMMQYAEIAAIFNLVALLAGIVYTYQLYHAHGDVMKAMDARLRWKWYRLFGWALAMSLLKTVASMLFSSYFAHLVTTAPGVVTLFYILIDIPRHLVVLLSIIYLHRTIQKIQQYGGSYGNQGRSF